MRPGEGAAVRAAIVGGGVSGSSASRRAPAARASIAATDVEQVLRIKHLLLVEGLTLAGARRRLEEETAPVAADAPAIDELIGQNARERLTEVKRGLQSILDRCSRVSRTPASCGWRRRSPRRRAVRSMPEERREAKAPASRNGIDAVGAEKSR